MTSPRVHSRAVSFCEARGSAPSCAIRLKNYAGLCGSVLARAHARTVDPVVLTGYMGKSTAFEDALADFSVAYADQNERDHAALVAAVRDGKVEAQME